MKRVDLFWSYFLQSNVRFFIAMNLIKFESEYLWEHENLRSTSLEVYEFNRDIPSLDIYRKVLN